MNRKTERSAYWDIVKGLAIIAIVMGHCGILTAYVYLFHLAVFFFVTGYFYNENKYGDDPFRYLGARLAGCWPRFLFYGVCCVLLHNFFVAHGLYAGAEPYNHTTMLACILQGVVLQYTEPMQGAMWFVPVWVLSSACFCGIVWFGRTVARRLGSARGNSAVTAAGFPRTASVAASLDFARVLSAVTALDSKHTSSDTLPPNSTRAKSAGNTLDSAHISSVASPPGSSRIESAVIALGVLAAGTVGLFLFDRQCYLPYNLQCAVLAVPFYYAAWMMRRHLPFFKRFATWYGAIISALLLYLIHAKLHITIDISTMNIPGFFYFPISLLGIYLVLAFAALAERIPVLSKGLAFLGKHSFDIMALHFLTFKFIDLAYARFAAASVTAENLSGFPVGFRGELGPIYLVLGVLLPALAGWGLDNAVHFLLPKKR